MSCASKRTLLVQSTNFPIEVLYLRDDDIPQSVASGVADIGIVGDFCPAEIGCFLPAQNGDFLPALTVF